MKIIISIQGLVFCLILDTNADGAEKISQPFHYSGYSRAEYRDYEKLVTYVPLSDGVKLAADIYLPKTKFPKKFPSIVWYTSGHRESINPETGEKRSRSGDAMQFFTSYGYAYLAVEMRGSGASTGSRFDRSPQIGIDGKELVDWIAKQSWSDGNVVTWGNSYTGITSELAASLNHPAIKCHLVNHPPAWDAYRQVMFPGGCFNEFFIKYWSARF